MKSTFAAGKTWSPDLKLLKDAIEDKTDHKDWTLYREDDQIFSFELKQPDTDLHNSTCGEEEAGILDAELTNHYESWIQEDSEHRHVMVVVAGIIKNIDQQHDLEHCLSICANHGIPCKLYDSRENAIKRILHYVKNYGKRKMLYINHSSLRTTLHKRVASIPFVGIIGQEAVDAFYIAIDQGIICADDIDDAFAHRWIDNYLKAKYDDERYRKYHEYIFNLIEPGSIKLSTSKDQGDKIAEESPKIAISDVKNNDDDWMQSFLQ